MSFQQDYDAPSTSSTMLNLRTLLEPVAPSSDGTGILSLAVKSLQGMTKSGEKFDLQGKKIGRKKSVPTVEEREIDGMEIDLEESVDEHNISAKNVQQQSSAKEEKKLRIISLDEVAWHDTPDDCWLSIYDYVYDCTSFIKDHPGGDDVLLEYAGRDATLAFIGAGHSKFAQKALERYLIGELPRNERIFRIDGGVKVFGF